jgi:hypothetical protein
MSNRPFSVREKLSPSRFVVWVGSFLKAHLMEQPDRLDPALDFEGFSAADS